MPEIRLLRDDVYVELVDVVESDIIVKPDWNPSWAVSPDMPVRGRVLAVGSGRITRQGAFWPQCVQVGDLIHFHFGGVELYYPDRRHAVVSGKSIAAVFEA